MVTIEENQRLTEVGRGTEMGELLRRYWHPIAAVSEFEGHATKPVRLLGEDLVLFRDRSGQYGLLERHCPHRRADLSYGFVEECGLRCNYHGWLFDQEGRCIEQPFEEVTGTSRFKERIKVAAYEIRECAGLLFAYLGPQPAPPIPLFEPLTYTDGFVQIVFSEVACNWLQCQENSIDPVHFEWLHSNWTRELTGDHRRAPTHQKIDFVEFAYGFGYRRLLAGEDTSSRSWQWQRLCILPHLFQPINHFEWRIPIDDRRTLTVVWHYSRLPSDRAGYRQETIPHWYAPSSEGETGRYRSTHVINQDTIAWVGQGEIADRENEHLGRSDEGVRMLRRQLLADMAAVARGDVPKGIAPDESVIHLPGRSGLREPLDRDAWWEDLRLFHRNTESDYFSLLAGQPIEVRTQFEAAAGITHDEFVERVQRWETMS